MLLSSILAILTFTVPIVAVSKSASSTALMNIEDNNLKWENMSK